jgi:hypothetical protein
VEVRLQTRRHPELHATTATPFTRVGKAILLPLHSELTARVNAWLTPQIEGSEISQHLEDELAGAH